MFYITQDSSDIIGGVTDWSNLDADVSALEESSWEILNVNNAHEGIKQHWFKQNYIDRLGQQGSQHNNQVLHTPIS
jgi:hypothetical protein